MQTRTTPTRPVVQLLARGLVGGQVESGGSSAGDLTGVHGSAGQCSADLEGQHLQLQGHRFSIAQSSDCGFGDLQSRTCSPPAREVDALHAGEGQQAFRKAGGAGDPLEGPRRLLRNAGHRLDRAQQVVPLQVGTTPLAGFAIWYIHEVWAGQVSSRSIWECSRPTCTAVGQAQAVPGS